MFVFHFARLEKVEPLSKVSPILPVGTSHLVSRVPIAISMQSLSVQADCNQIITSIA